MDSRIRRHAELLVEHATDIENGDYVLIKAPAAAEELVVALHTELGKRGALPLLQWRNPRAGAAYARELAVEDFETKEHERAAMAEADAVILVAGNANAMEGHDIAPEKAQANSEANAPVLEERLQARWVITQHPTRADAQNAEMGTDAWADFVYDAIDHDWEAQREKQARVAAKLEAGEEVRIVAGDRTDLSLSIAGMSTVNCHGKRNMPDGEVATVPVIDSAEGTVHFDFPRLRAGKRIEGAWLAFEAGEVVEFGATRGEDALEAIIETDDGSRRLGELGIGMNRGIDRFSGNILFDEKMGDTVHLALGDALAECVPDARETNESATHVDFLVDMREDTRIEVDGETVQRDGRFWFEDGFDA
ncbi:aminopeptidase [Natronomonas sp. EA1]|uniref:aminopeptidase n=1 Tax=Natronomonas sp. EA1 TaxID=3421655 RepID=UPI003EBCC618